MASLKFIKDRKCWRVWWHVTFPDHVDKGSKTFKKREDALRFKNHVEQNARKFKRQHQLAGSILIIKAKEDWLTYCQRHTQTTQYLYKMVIDAFVDSLQVESFNAILPAHIQDYLSQLASNRRTNRTLNCHLTAVKSFCRYISDRLDIPNPATKVHKLKEDPPEANFLTKQQYKKLLKACNPETKKYVEFLANTGLRASEFVELKWKNYSFSI